MISTPTSSIVLLGVKQIAASVHLLTRLYWLGQVWFACGQLCNCRAAVLSDSLGCTVLVRFAFGQVLNSATPGQFRVEFPTLSGQVQVASFVDAVYNVGTLGGWSTARGDQPFE